MKKRLFFLLMIMILCGSLISCTKKNVVSDDLLQLELIISDTEYAIGEPIECKAILTYIGKGDSYTFYPNDRIVKIVIDGGEYFNGVYDLVSKDIIYPAVTIYKDQSMEFSFVKYGGTYLESDKEAAAFWKEFMEEETLFLEKGEYEIIACCQHRAEKGKECQTLMVSEKIVVR